MSDLKQEDTLVDALQQAQIDMQEIKNRQFAGADNLHIVLNQSLAIYDQSVTVLPGPGNDGFMTVTFDADSQDYPFADPIFYLYIDGTTSADLLAKFKPTEGIGAYHGAVVPLIILSREIISSSLSPKRVQWELRLVGFYTGTHTFYVKAYVYSADAGVVS